MQIQIVIIRVNLIKTRSSHSVTCISNYIAQPLHKEAIRGCSFLYIIAKKSVIMSETFIADVSIVWIKKIRPDILGVVRKCLLNGHAHCVAIRWKWAAYYGLSLHLPLNRYFVYWNSKESRDCALIWAYDACLFKLYQNRKCWLIYRPSLRKFVVKKSQITNK